jgi:hypothetical protein
MRPQAPKSRRHIGWSMWRVVWGGTQRECRDMDTPSGKMKFFWRIVHVHDTIRLCRKHTPKHTHKMVSSPSN